MVGAALAVNPERFGRYVLLDRIGEGGMAEIFRAIMPGVEGFKRTLVVKRILSSHSKSAKFVDMFVREAHIGAMLNHPNIVQVYDFGNVDGHYFLAMEYLRGRDLLAIIRRMRETRRAFPVPVAAFIAHEIATCLAYAHALTGPDGRCLDIIHRDVSPSNVMCLREGGVKLLDFGIAKALGEEGVEHTEQGAFKGKLAYMAPERIRGDKLDGRCDLYSLGVVLWEMLTCRRLFRGASEVDTFKNILEKKVVPPSAERHEVPPALDAVVMRALERDRAKRYLTGQEMADDLEEVLRETKFQSRMMPNMLVELFGSGLQSSQVAFSCLTPELLAAIGAGPIEPAPGLADFRTSLRERRRGRVHLAIATAAAVVCVALAFVVGVFSFRNDKPALPPGASAVEKASVAKDVPPAPAMPALVPSSGARSPEKAAVTATGSSTRTKKPVVTKRPVLPSDQQDAIGKGLSIDPFKEAESRGMR